MKINLDLETIFDKLKRNPFAFYLLFKDYFKKSNELPKFIDRGKEITFLSTYNLGSKQIKSKHSHNNPLKISPFGKKFVGYVEKTSFFSIFENIPLDSREDFWEYYKLKLEIFENLEEWNFNYDNHEIFRELFELPPIGKKYTQDKTIFYINKFRCSNFTNNEYEFELKFKCKKCNHVTIFTQKFYISEENYEPLNFDYPCSHCGCNFYSDSFFRSFYMDS